MLPKAPSNELFGWYDFLYSPLKVSDLPPSYRYGTPSEQFLRMHQQLMRQEKEQVQ